MFKIINFSHEPNIIFPIAFGLGTSLSLEKAARSRTNGHFTRVLVWIYRIICMK